MPKPAERHVQPPLGSLGPDQALAVLVNHVLGGAGDEVRVVELPARPISFGLQRGDLFGQAGLLRRPGR